MLAASPNWHAKPMLIALTGGIGCGKSTASKIFRHFDFEVLDTDQIVRDHVLRQPEVLESARRRWGSGVIDANGHLQRPAVAEKVFSNPTERAWWENVVHPRVGSRWRSLVTEKPQIDWLVEIPLLFENSLEKEFDFVVCVGANPSIQVSRIVARGLSVTQAEQRIAAQLPLASKIKNSHFVLWNDGSLDFLNRQVATIATLLKHCRPNQDRP